MSRMTIKERLTNLQACRGNKFNAAEYHKRMETLFIETAEDTAKNTDFQECLFLTAELELDAGSRSEKLAQLREICAALHVHDHLQAQIIPFVPNATPPQTGVRISWY